MSQIVMAECDECGKGLLLNLPDDVVELMEQGNTKIKCRDCDPWESDDDGT